MNKRQRVASYGLILCQNKILLTQHGKGPNIGFWGFPGGGVEYGEDPLESLQRELQEEADIVVANFKLDDVISSVLEYSIHDTNPEEIHNVGIVYEAKVPNLLNVKRGGDGISCLDAKWFDFSELSDEIVSKPIRPYLKKKKIMPV